jgi:hypothetical protein
MTLPYSIYLYLDPSVLKVINEVPTILYDGRAKYGPTKPDITSPFTSYTPDLTELSLDICCLGARKFFEVNDLTGNLAFRRIKEGFVDVGPLGLNMIR